ENDFKPIWTGNSSRDKARRAALLRAISEASMHGLPTDRYGGAELQQNLRSVRSERELGRLEVEMSKAFLTYARDVNTGILTPSRVDGDIVRKVPLRSRTSLLVSLAKSSPQAFMNALPPQTPEYARLMKAKVQFEQKVARGGFGAKVAAKSLKPGASGQSVVQLRDRLIAMGYLRRNAGTQYDDRMRNAVAKFQRDHGLFTDGVAGPRTMAAINTSAANRLSQIIVAMERERWTNMDRGQRHIWVNLTDFSAQIVDNGKVTFETRSVIGKNQRERRSPEFSDVMEYMVINPTWYVPRSITVKEYLPLLQQNPNSVRHLNLVRGGRVVSREGVDFTQYDEQTFPYDMREPPSQGNALGLVKFMFPNRYNIYLHDTPAKSLFGREKRDFSHGCIRLNDPFDFAYELLSKQESNPQQFFQARLATGNETYVNLEKQVPVHLVYRTAFTRAKGAIQFRGDVYGRDAKIWRALEAAGVSLSAVQG
ncbi:MAG: L,D-transpeptidase family protein, partial [Pseudomonadota bacterium]